jgi:hypothetical protein
MPPNEGSFFTPSDGLAKSDTESALKLLQTDAYRRAKPLAHRKSGARDERASVGGGAIHRPQIRTSNALVVNKERT